MSVLATNRLQLQLTERREEAPEPEPERIIRAPCSAAVAGEGDCTAALTRTSRPERCETGRGCFRVICPIMGSLCERRPSRAEPSQDNRGAAWIHSRAGTNLNREHELFIFKKNDENIFDGKDVKSVGVRMINHNMTHINQYSSSTSHCSSADYLIDS